MTPENYKLHTERLKSIQKEETEISNKSCRYAVNTIIATVLGLLVKDSIHTNESFDSNIFKTLLLFVVLLIAIVFYCVESWKRYTYANKARILYDELYDGTITDDTLITNPMKGQDDKSFVIYKYQLYMCGLMTILLLVCIIVELIK